MNFQNTLEFARQLDTQDELAPYRNEFHFPQHNNKNVIYFTGNSLGLQPKRAKKFAQLIKDKYGNSEYPFHIILEKAEKYKNKHSLSELEFNEFQRIYENELVEGLYLE